MFGYNILSDLKTGELVTPLRKENGKIICLNSLNEEVVYNFSDFDFDKKEEDRKSEQLPTETEEILTETEQTYEELVKYIDDSINDGTDKPKDETHIEDSTVETEEGFCYNDKMLKALNLKKGIFYKDNIKVSK